MLIDHKDVLKRPHIVYSIQIMAQASNMLTQQQQHGKYVHPEEL